MHVQRAMRGRDFEDRMPQRQVCVQVRNGSRNYRRWLCHLQG